MHAQHARAARPAWRFTRALTRAPWLQDKRTSERTHGRAFRGQRTKTTRLFVRGKRYSLVPVMSAQGLLDWYICEGSVDAERFLDFIGAAWCARLALRPTHAARADARAAAQIPRMQPFPNPHSVLVMDNFTTHHGEAVLSEVAAAGGVTLHTPAYGCDMTPVEHIFSKAKAYLRGVHKARLDTVRRRCAALHARHAVCAHARAPRAQMDPVDAIDEACQQITMEDCRGWMAHACSMYNDFYLQS